MKTITRKNLDELEKRMPVVSENEQKDRMGRAVYVDYQGYIYGRIGNGFFCVLGSIDMYYYAVEHHLEYYGIHLFDAGKEGFMDPIHPGREIQKKVFTKYAQDVINYSGKITLVEDQYADDLYYNAGPDREHGELCFNVIRSGIIFNEDWLIDGLKEVDKIIQGSSSGNVPGGDKPGMTDAERIQKQIDDIMAIIADFDRAYGKGKGMESAREAYASQLCALWHSQGHAGMGYEIWDAYRICGVNDPKDKI